MAGYLARPYAKRNGLKKKKVAASRKRPNGYTIAKGEVNKVQFAERLGVTTKTLENWLKAKEALLAKKQRTPAENRLLADMVPLPIRRSARHVRWKLKDITTYEARKKT